VVHGVVGALQIIVMMVMMVMMMMMIMAPLCALQSCNIDVIVISMKNALIDAVALTFDHLTQNRIISMIFQDHSQHQV